MYKYSIVESLNEVNVIASTKEGQDRVYKELS